MGGAWCRWEKWQPWRTYRFRKLPATKEKDPALPLSDLTWAPGSACSGRYPPVATDHPQDCKQCRALKHASCEWKSKINTEEHTQHQNSIIAINMPQLSRCSLHLLLRSSQSRCLGYQHLDPLSLVPSTWMMRSRPHSVSLWLVRPQELHGRNRRFLRKCLQYENAERSQKQRKSTENESKKLFGKEKKKTSSKLFQFAMIRRLPLQDAYLTHWAKSCWAFLIFQTCWRSKKLWRKNVENQMLLKVELALKWAKAQSLVLARKQEVAPQHFVDPWTPKTQEAKCSARVRSKISAHDTCEESVLHRNDHLSTVRLCTFIRFAMFVLLTWPVSLQCLCPLTCSASHPALKGGRERRSSSVHGGGVQVVEFPRKTVKTVAAVLFSDNFPWIDHQPPRHSAPKRSSCGSLWTSKRCSSSSSRVRT